MAVEHYRTLEKNASDCIECGHCDSRCPFRVRQSGHFTHTLSHPGNSLRSQGKAVNHDAPVFVTGSFDVQLVGSQNAVLLGKQAVSNSCKSGVFSLPGRCQCRQGGAGFNKYIMGASQMAFLPIK